MDRFVVYLQKIIYIGGAMNIEQTQLCPWISILPKVEIQQLEKENKENEVLSLIKMLAQVTLESIEKYKNSEYAQLDALVGNNGCEVQAFNILSLAYSAELKKECTEMKTTCQKILEWIRHRQSIQNPKKREAECGPLDQVYTKIQGMSSISPEMMYLIQSRLLTVVKDYKYDETKYDTRKYESFETKPEYLRNLIKKTTLKDPVLNRIVSVVQSEMSLSSILFMRAKLDQLAIANEKEGRLVKKMMSLVCTYTEDDIYPPKRYSCGYYNAKAVLLLLAELKAPLIVKKLTKMGAKLKHFAFKCSGEFGQFKEMSKTEKKQCAAETPVIVCLAYLPEICDEEWLKKVREYGLGNMILANISKGSQYVPEKKKVFPIREEEALEEIAQAKVNAKKVECVWMKASILDVDHFYCSSWGKRKVNVGDKGADNVGGSKP